MDYPLAVWGGPPVTTAGLFHYAARKKAALQARDTFGARVDTANRVLERLGGSYPVLQAEIAELERQIVLTRPKAPRAMVGSREWASATCSIDIALESNTRQREARKDQCRRLYRLLAQKHHPDKGGDFETFQRLRQAMISLDLEYLAIQQALMQDEPALAWRCAEGAEFWDLQSKRVHVNSLKLESVPQYRIVACHLSGNKSAALSMMRKWMEQQLIVLKHELAHILNPRLYEPTDEM